MLNPHAFSADDGTSQQSNLACPSCMRSDRIDIAALVWVRHSAVGTDPNDAADNSHEWAEDSACVCRVCGHPGTVREFRSLDENPEHNRG
jgi:hypothetical protein